MTEFCDCRLISIGSDITLNVASYAKCKLFAQKCTKSNLKSRFCSGTKLVELVAKQNKYGNTCLHALFSHEKLLDVAKHMMMALSRCKSASSAYRPNNKVPLLLF